ncbi:MAG: metal ABC transporter permease, partial [Candidatus Paceibacterota bacterium]
MEIINPGFFIAITAAFVGAAAGYLGSFMVLRKMALVGDAMSHVALPGLAVALVLGYNPFWGALLALIMATFVIWILEDKTSISTEALVGILFTTSLAVGILIVPDHELLEALFGDISKVGVYESVVAMVLSAVA